MHWLDTGRFRGFREDAFLYTKNSSEGIKIFQLHLNSIFSALHVH